MQSLIKRHVEISLDAHVQHIIRLVEDAYILQKEREVESGQCGTGLRRDNMLYYRMLRRTGHTAALKKLLSDNFQEDIDAYIWAVFQTATELQNYQKSSGSKCERATTILGRGTDIQKANIIIFPDAVSDPDRLKAAQMTFTDVHSFPNLRLVVFLG